VGFKVIKAMMTPMIFFRFSPSVDCLVKANVSAKRDVSIFRAETLASTEQSTRRLNPKEHNQNIFIYSSFLDKRMKTKRFSSGTLCFLASHHNFHLVIKTFRSDTFAGGIWDRVSHPEYALKFLQRRKKSLYRTTNLQLCNFLNVNQHCGLQLHVVSFCSCTDFFMKLEHNAGADSESSG
jgi:hypothetical protein